jgi:hypothetical protein
MAYDQIARRVIRWGGHAQGGIKGSGEQISEVWTLDPTTMKWEHKEPNRSPPPACCASQQVFDTGRNRFLRVRAASGSHGWHWFRMLYLNNSSVWSYDLATNTWRDMRPLPEPVVGGAMHCASWDSDREVMVVFGGEGSQEGTHVYDPHTNTWTSRQNKVRPMTPPERWEPSLRRRTQGPHPVRLTVRRRQTHLGLRRGQERMARSEASRPAADLGQRRGARL